MLVQSKPLLLYDSDSQLWRGMFVHISETVHIEQTTREHPMPSPKFHHPHIYGPKSMYIPNLHRGFWGWNDTVTLRIPANCVRHCFKPSFRTGVSILEDENMEGQWNHKMSTLSSWKIHFFLGASFWHPSGTIEIMTSQLRHEAFAGPVCHAAFDVDLQKRDHLVVDQETHKPQGSGSQRMNTCINYTHTLYRFWYILHVQLDYIWGYNGI